MAVAGRRHNSLTPSRKILIKTSTPSRIRPVSRPAASSRIQARNRRQEDVHRDRRQCPGQVLLPEDRLSRKGRNVRPVISRRPAVRQKRRRSPPSAEILPQIPPHPPWDLPASMARPQEEADLLIILAAAALAAAVVAEDLVTVPVVAVLAAQVPKRIRPAEEAPSEASPVELAGVRASAVSLSAVVSPKKQQGAAASAIKISLPHKRALPIVHSMTVEVVLAVRLVLIPQTVHLALAAADLVVLLAVSLIPALPQANRLVLAAVDLDGLPVAVLIPQTAHSAPVAAVLERQPPRPRINRKFLNPAAQELESLQLQKCPLQVFLALSSAWQELVPAALNVLPLLSPGTAGMRPHLSRGPQLKRRGPIRYSRNNANLPPQDRHRRKAAAPFPVPAQQEHLRPLKCPVWVLLALSPAQQEWVPAVPAGRPSLNPGMAGTVLRLQPHPRPERRVPSRYSRNSAGSPGKASLR